MSDFLASPILSAALLGVIVGSLLAQCTGG